MKPEYYKPGQIFYSEPQILWLLRNVLFQDTWPSDHKETGYTFAQNEKGMTLGHHANYETIRMIIGELSARLRLCGIAGLYLEYLTLIDYEDRVFLEARLAGYTKVTPREVNHQARMALRYCCGHKRKQMTFERYCVRTKSDDKAKKRREE